MTEHIRQDRDVLADAHDDGQRLDHVVRRHVPALSRAAVAQAVTAGHVRVNGQRARKGHVVRKGDTLTLALADYDAAGLPGADPSLALPVLHEDAWLLVLDKPAGIASGALRPGERGTVAS